MRLRSVILLVILLFSTANLVRGQEPDRPFPPAHAAIFPSYVTVISERVTGFSPAIPAPTWPTLDDDQRIITMSIGEEVRQFPYPDEINATRDLQYLASQGIFIFTAEVGDPNARYLAWEYYALDAISGKLALYEPCEGTVLRGQEGWSLVSAYPDDLVYVVDPQAATAHLCNRTTGAVSVPLPINEIGGPFGWSEIIQAPHDDWLLLVAGSNLGGHYSFYGFRHSTGEIVSLGIVGGQSFLGSFEGWLNDTEFIFQIKGSIDGRNGIYRGDITQPDSFGIVVPGEVEYIDDTTESLWNNGAVCQLNLYNFDVNEPQAFLLANTCVGVFRLPNRTYLAAISATENSRYLDLIDTTIDEQTLLYQAEIELLYGVSPDGRYAVLLTDRNGQIDYTGQADFDWNQLDTLQVTFFDTVTHTVVYQADYAGWPAPFYHRAHLEVVGANRSHRFNQGVSWLSNNRALLQRAEDYLLLSFEDDQPVDVIAVHDVFDTYPGGDYLILQTGDEYDATTYHIFDISLGVTMPLFTPNFPTDEYIVNVFGHKSLVVQIAPASQRDDAWTTYVTYQVQIKLE